MQLHSSPLVLFAALAIIYGNAAVLVVFFLLPLAFGVLVTAAGRRRGHAGHDLAL